MDRTFICKPRRVATDSVGRRNQTIRALHTASLSMGHLNNKSMPSCMEAISLKQSTRNRTKFPSRPGYNREGFSHTALPREARPVFWVPNIGNYQPGRSYSSVTSTSSSSSAGCFGHAGILRPSAGFATLGLLPRSEAT